MPNHVKYDQPLPTIERSEALWQRSLGLIPAGTQTLEKGPTQYVRGVAPKYLIRGRGSHVWDADENEYIDLTMANGPLSLGYAYPRVNQAVLSQLERGITFSLMHPLEVEVSELVRKVVPGAASVRFSKTGSDVTSAAVRLARAFTGRDRVLCAGYHGWHDWYAAATPRSAGVPAAVKVLTQKLDRDEPYDLLDALDETVACVILEPALFDIPDPGFFAVLRQACRESGALLVLDETWTGFRLALGGAQERFDVTADLACFSKAIANGMPLSVLSGRADVMQLLDDKVLFFTTFGGEALSLAAAQATISELSEKRVTVQLEWQGSKLRDGYNQLARERRLDFTRCKGFGARSMVVFDASAGSPLEQKSLMQQELLRHGVLWSGFHNLSFSHEDADIAHVLGAYGRALDVLADATRKGNLRARILGEPIGSAGGRRPG